MAETDVEEISTHAPRTGSDGGRISTLYAPKQFQPTLPARGATATACLTCRATSHFNPRSPHGERRIYRHWLTREWYISTHAPRTGSDSAGGHEQDRPELISTHAPRTGSDTASLRFEPPPSGISTHAPRTGSDQDDIRATLEHCDFNPRSPHGERLADRQGRSFKRLFQPTLPARGATTIASRCASTCTFQPTLPARGATWYRDATRTDKRHFNPRSPHGERLTRLMRARWHGPFQPTLPARGATPARGTNEAAEWHFNPRSPHGERQWFADSLPALRAYFNPRSPHGERRLSIAVVVPAPLFQPTLPARGATSGSAICFFTLFHFNPRSPHGERRLGSPYPHCRVRDFNPRSPHGERPRPDNQFFFV